MNIKPLTTILRHMAIIMTLIVCAMAPDIASAQLPEFNGSGLTIDGCGYTIAPQPDRFNADDFGPLMTTRDFNLVFDFSDATVSGRKFTDFARMTSRRKMEPEKWLDRFYRDLNRETFEFIDEFNDNSRQWKICFDETLPTTLVVKIRTIDSEDGGDYTADYAFVNTATGQVIAGVRMTAEGGTYGSFTNLMGDAFEDAGESLARKFTSATRKYKRKHN